MHPNLMRTRAIASMMLLLFGVAIGAMAADAPQPPGGLKLLSGYIHEPQQGFDSIVGRIFKKDGITISYEVGRVRAAGGLAIGGDFSSAVERLPKDDVKWSREQTVAGQLMQVALTKKDVLYVTFPKMGTNFNATVKSMDDLSDTLLMLVTYPEPRKADAPTELPKEIPKEIPKEVPKVPAPKVPKPKIPTPKIPTIP
jgi:hypothetical protein